MKFAKKRNKSIKTFSKYYRLSSTFYGLRLPTKKKMHYLSIILISESILKPFFDFLILPQKNSLFQNLTYKLPEK